MEPHIADWPGSMHEDVEEVYFANGNYDKGASRGNEDSSRMNLQGYQEYDAVDGMMSNDNIFSLSDGSPSILVGSEQQQQQQQPSKALYLSHAISTWNSRGFEFGAVLFLAAIYPGTLLPMSVYALVRALAAIVFSPWVGRFIDARGRLGVVRLSILGQRCSVVLSCGLFWGLLLLADTQKNVQRSAVAVNVNVDLDLRGGDIWSLLKHAIFVGLVLLACVEKLCSIMNTVCVERDWVVVIAGERDDYLQQMNLQMRRIDLFCKLGSPLFVALLDGISSRTAISVTLVTSAAFVGAEYFLIARVYRLTPALARPRTASISNVPVSDQQCIPLEVDRNPDTNPSSHKNRNTPKSIIADLQAYFQSPAVLPSLSLSILYLTVLSFSGQMTTYLLAVPSPRFSSTSVGLVRTVSTIFELSSTFLAPKLISSIGAVRAGIWCLSWQAICLISGVGLLFGSSSGTLPRFILRDDGSKFDDSEVGVVALIVSVMLSRIGLWSFDLIAQLLIQNSIDSNHRGSFSSVEASLQNFFELCTFATTIVWSKPEQFKYPALVSLLAVLVAGACYATFVRSRRGHLIHLPPCLDLPWASARKLSLRRRYAIVPENEAGEDIAMADRR